MSRRTYLFTALTIVALSLAAPLMWTAARAQDDSAIPSDHPLIGTWRVTVSEEGMEYPAISTWSADGTYTDITPNVTAVAPDLVVFGTPSLGTWEGTGDNSGAFTAGYFYSDGQGNLSTVGTISGDFEVGDDGQTGTGSFSYAVFAPDGALVHAGEGMVEATRLTIVPRDELATPAATPAT